MSVFWGSFKEKIHIIPGLLNGALSIKHQGWYSLRKLEVTSWNQFWKNTFVSFYISVNVLQNCPTTVVFAFCHNVYTTWLGHCRLLVTSLFELQTPHFENEDNMYFSCKHTFICLAQDPMGSLFLPSWTSYTRPKHTNKIIQQTRLCQYIWPNRSLCQVPPWSDPVLFCLDQNQDFWSNVCSSWEELTVWREAALLALRWLLCPLVSYSVQFALMIGTQPSPWVGRNVTFNFP